MSCECTDPILGKVGASRRVVFGTSGTPSTTVITPPSAAALADGDLVSDLITFDCIANRADGTAIIDDVMIYEVAATGGVIRLDMDLVLVDTIFTPAGAGNDFVPPSPETIIGVVPVTLADYELLDADTAIARVRPGLAVDTLAGEKNIYGVLVSRAAGTYAAAAEIRVKLAARRD